MQVNAPMSAALFRSNGDQPRTASPAGRQSDAARQAEENISRIKEVGFRQWAEEENERKLEELRREILQSMGLSEQDLQEMSAARRASVERMVQDEIQQRLAATSQMNASADEKTGTDKPLAAMAHTVSRRLGLELTNPQTQLLAQENDGNNARNSNMDRAFNQHNGDRNNLAGG